MKVSQEGRDQNGELTPSQKPLEILPIISTHSAALQLWEGENGERRKRLSEVNAALETAISSGAAEKYTGFRIYGPRSTVLSW